MIIKYHSFVKDFDNDFFSLNISRLGSKNMSFDQSAGWVLKKKMYYDQ